MSLATDLLDQAELLATLDPRRPKQANLRRVVSASYYALFHLLTTEASALYAVDINLQARISRTHNHGDMKKVSVFFAANKLPKAIQPASAYAAPEKIRSIAKTFVTLQQLRHEADYDATRTYARQNALAVLAQARQAFADWEEVKKTDDARLYLACFLLWKKWDEEPR